MRGQQAELGSVTLGKSLPSLALVVSSTKGEVGRVDFDGPSHSSYVV